VTVDPLSKSLAEATRFVVDLYADIEAMMVSLDAAMEHAGWVQGKAHQHLDFNDGLSGYRLYARKELGSSSDRVVFVVFHLAPPNDADHDFATLLAAAVRFPTATTLYEVWRQWNPRNAMHRATIGRAEVTVLAPADFEKFTPGASAVAALTLPLCSLTGEADLRARVVEPILAAEKQLGAAT
jgi:hypothetical protein